MKMTLMDSNSKTASRQGEIELEGESHQTFPSLPLFPLASFISSPSIAARA